MVVEMRFTNPLLDTVVDRFGTENAQYVKTDDGHFTVTAQVEVDDQFFGWLMGLGKNAQLLCPESVIEQFRAYVDEIRELYVPYVYSAETRQKIVSLLRVGDADQICSCMDEVIEQNYHERSITGSMKECLVSEMVRTIVRGAQQEGRTEFVFAYLDHQNISDYTNAEEVAKYLHRLVHGVCNDVLSNELLRKNDGKFVERVREYVQQNYRNPDLNVSITALHFGISPSYLSSLFKEQTGMSLLDFINHTRVEHVQKLLEQGYSIAEISGKTGFRGSPSLIRVFKKITGMTPGQMKNTMWQTDTE